MTASARATDAMTNSVSPVSSAAASAVRGAAAAASMTKKGVTIAMNKNPKSLRFRPTAWAKLLYLRDAGKTEIGGFGITAADDSLLVEAIELVAQKTSPTSVEFLDESVADFFDAQVDAGRRPEQFGRVWIHTHPGNSPQPSATDEETFARVFGRTDWAAMFILARGGQSYARLRFSIGPGAELVIPVELDFRPPFAASDHEAWQVEYAACVRPETQVKVIRESKTSRVEAATRRLEIPTVNDEWFDAWYGYTAEDRSDREDEFGYLIDF
jgi:proteasome lid subunit RPN8/RPN11